MRYTIRYIYFLLVCALVVSSCSRAFESDIRTGAGEMFVEGAPEIRVSALGTFDRNDQPIISINTEVVIGSLIFSSSDGQYKAGSGLQIDIFRLQNEQDERGEHLEIVEGNFNIEDSDESVRESTETHNFEKQVQVPPGLYRIVATVTDQNSGQSSRSVSNVIVSDPHGERPVLTHVKVKGSKGTLRSAKPINTYSIPSRFDSLSFQFKISRQQNHGPVEMNMRLVRFKSDNQPPRRMSDPQPTRGSIQFRGIDYAEKQIIEESTRMLRDEEGIIDVEFNTPIPDRGAYRFEVSLKKEGRSGEHIDRKARDFGIVHSNFPNIVTVRDMARSMRYLMSERRHQELLNIEDDDSLKEAMDRFWLENLESIEQATSVIEKYFNRVEEANRQFTNFKEGWMTDLGMMYILFGPPFYQERHVDRITWIYGYDRQNPEKVFRFERARTDSDQYPFDHFVLQRNRAYHDVEYRQRQRWLTGVILNRPI